MITDNVGVILFSLSNIVIERSLNMNKRFLISIIFFVISICGFLIGKYSLKSGISEENALKIAEKHFEANYNESFLEDTSIKVRDAYMVLRYEKKPLDAMVYVFLDKENGEVLNIFESE